MQTSLLGLSIDACSFQISDLRVDLQFGLVDTPVMHSCEALDILEMLLQCLNVTGASASQSAATRAANVFSVCLKLLAHQTSVTSCTNQSIIIIHKA